MPDKTVSRYFTFFGYPSRMLAGHNWPECLCDGEWKPQYDRRAFHQEAKPIDEASFNELVERAMADVRQNREKTAATEDHDERGLSVELGDDRERAEHISEIIYGLYGDDALEHVKDIAAGKAGDRAAQAEDGHNS
jgi:hypothetical protein